MKTIVISEEAHEAQKTGGRKGAATRHDKRTYAQSIVRDWPTLDDQVRAEIRQILAPVFGLVAQNGGE